MGHFKKANTTPKRKLVEFTSFEKELNLGDVVTVDIFEDDDWVDVTGISKGKGFQGVVKRHGFGGVGGQTHGQHNRQRKPVRWARPRIRRACSRASAFRGRTGGDRVKVLNLRILKKLPENNLLLVKGSIPGAKGSYLIIED